MCVCVCVCVCVREMYVCVCDAVKQMEEAAGSVVSCMMWSVRYLIWIVMS